MSAESAPTQPTTEAAPVEVDYGQHALSTDPAAANQLTVADLYNREDVVKLSADAIRRQRHQQISVGKLVAIMSDERAKADKTKQTRGAEYPSIEKPADTPDPFGHEAILREEAEVADSMAQETPVESGHENSHELSFGEAVRLLSYSDVMTGEQRDQFQQYTETSDSGLKYVDTLMKLVGEQGRDAVDAMADKLHAEYVKAMRDLNVESSVYGDSKSWAYWDIAKQSYMAEHPSESGSEYIMEGRQAPVSPFEQSDEAVEQQRTIVNRHVGWEIALQLDDPAQRQSALENLGEGQAAQADITEIKKIVESGPDNRNDTNQLRSHVLADVGAIALRGVN